MPVADNDQPEPRHIAIVMDGNGRWAQERGLPRHAGHRAGMEALRRTVRACCEIGTRRLTVYSFSTENWRRPPSEIASLFALMREYMRHDLRRLVDEGVRIDFIGSRDGLTPEILAMIDEAEQVSAGGERLDLLVAFNYGGRAEIVAAARRLCIAADAGDLDPATLDEQTFAANLWSGDAPEPDLIIRTGGEHRLSNFLLWGAAYAELVFVDAMWPDFDKTRLLEAVASYRRRRRRFGAAGDMAVEA